MSAADEYKAVVNSLTEGFDGDASRNRARMDALGDELRVLRRRLDEAADRYTAARVGNILAWEDALELLWVEQWMTMRPFPRPDRIVKGDGADAAVAAVQACIADLRAAVQRRGFGRS